MPYGSAFVDELDRRHFILHVLKLLHLCPAETVKQYCNMYLRLDVVLMTRDRRANMEVRRGFGADLEKDIESGQ
jgi:hypothetical protein